MRRKFSLVEQQDYADSNAKTEVDFKITPSMRRKVGDLAVWLAEGDQSRVKETTQMVLDLLCDAAEISPTKLKLKDTADSRIKGDKLIMKLYGTCEPDGTITVAFRTAVRHKVFAFKTFLRTVIHEYVHWYDHRKLNLGASFHTSGFYQRVRDLYTQLLPDPSENVKPACHI